MFYRATSFAIGAQSIRFVQQYSSNILNYQNQISSGLRIHRPSDDPVGFRQVASFSARLQELRTEAFSLRDAENKLNTGVSQLQESNKLLSHAKVLTQQGISALTQSERNAIAVEVESLLASLQGITKTSSAGAFLFGGTRTDEQPYEFSKPLVAGGTLNVEYFGSYQNSRALVGEAVAVDTFYAGTTVFADPDRGETILFGKTGAALAAGTDNLIGRATLQVRHTSTTYVGRSGIAAGTSSVDGDTIIGPAGQFSVTINDTSGDGSAGTISLGGDREIAWTNTDTDLQVTSPSGQKIYVDMSAISPGFSGSVDIVADGTLSVDGGLTTEPIDFSSGQTITDSTTGRFVPIDSSKISRAGDDYLEFPGTSDAFQIVYELVQDLRNTRNLDGEQLAASLDRRLGELSNMSDHVLNVMGQQSASLQTLRQLEFRIQDLELETETQLNNIQSTDIAETVLRLQNEQTLLEYTYAITAEISSIGLIDFLR
jgi:flagellar hook-associated protein 3 FlgL